VLSTTQKHFYSIDFGKISQTNVYNFQTDG